MTGRVDFFVKASTVTWQPRPEGCAYEWAQQVALFSARIQGKTERSVATTFQAKPGAIIDGRYMLVKPLGRGGMGETWVALSTKDTGMDERAQVVIKLIKPEYRGEKKYLVYFKREAAIAMLASEASLVRTFDMDIYNGIPYCVMEWVRGITLADLWKAERWTKLKSEQRSVYAAHCVFNVLTALQFLHELKGVNNEPLEVIHRDVCPTNVFVSLWGDVKLGDFGVARSKHKYHMEHSGAGLIGKVPYMCSLHLKLNHYDPLADLFAAGALLYELLECSPFRGEYETQEALLAAVARGHVPPLSDAHDSRLVEIYQRLTTFGYGSASEAIAAIESLQIPFMKASLGRLVCDITAQDPSATNGIKNVLASLTAEDPEEEGKPDEEEGPRNNDKMPSESLLGTTIIPDEDTSLNSRNAIKDSNGQGENHREEDEDRPTGVSQTRITSVWSPPEADAMEVETFDAIADSGKVWSRRCEEAPTRPVRAARDEPIDTDAAEPRPRDVIVQRHDRGLPVPTAGATPESSGPEPVDSVSSPAFKEEPLSLERSTIDAGVAPTAPNALRRSRNNTQPEPHSEGVIFRRHRGQTVKAAYSPDSAPALSTERLLPEEQRIASQQSVTAQNEHLASRPRSQTLEAAPWPTPNPLEMTPAPGSPWVDESRTTKGIGIGTLRKRVASLGGFGLGLGTGLAAAFVYINLYAPLPEVPARLAMSGSGLTSPEVLPAAPEELQLSLEQTTHTVTRIERDNELALAKPPTERVSETHKTPEAATEGKRNPLASSRTEDKSSPPASKKTESMSSSHRSPAAPMLPRSPEAKLRIYLSGLESAQVRYNGRTVDVTNDMMVLIPTGSLELAWREHRGQRWNRLPTPEIEKGVLTIAKISRDDSWVRGVK